MGRFNPERTPPSSKRSIAIAARAQQKVTVEHVHVHSGGQAVVGMVETPGEGTHSKSEEQPRAQQIAYALEPALPSSDEDRDALPVARNQSSPCSKELRCCPIRQ
jgi:hypothetical protein